MAIAGNGGAVILLEHSSGGGGGGGVAVAVAAAVAVAVAELAVDDNMARWRNGPVCMWAPDRASRSSLANKGFFFDWIPRQEGAEKFTGGLAPRVQPAALAMPSA